MALINKALFPSIATFETPPRLATVHEQEELHDTPRYFLTDAKHWESTRIMETWSYDFNATVTG
jgi:hypothetical protein